MSFDPSSDFTPDPVTVTTPEVAGTVPDPVTVKTPAVANTTPVSRENGSPVPLMRDRRHFDENGQVELDEHDQPTLSEPHFPTP